MRLVALVLLAALAPIPLAWAVAEPCIPSCEVPSHTLAFLPGITEAPSGATVTWTTLDVGHTATDRSSFCFHTDFRPNVPGAATFTIHDGALYATSEWDVDALCSAALPLADASFLLEYTCLFHPNMKAQLVVR